MCYENFCLLTKHIKRIAGISTGIFVFCVIYIFLNYIYAPGDDWERILWHNFYEDKGKIDNVYIGSSHVFYDINAVKLDDINGQHNFNLSSVGQQLNGAYFLLKEAHRNNSLSHVYLELYYMYSTKDNFNSYNETLDTEHYHNWKNIDYMKFSCNKIEYMLSVSGIEGYVDMLFPFTRYRASLDDWESIKKMMEKKQGNDYRSYEYQDEIREFRKQGYYYSSREFMDRERFFRQTRIFKENPMGEKSERYLRRFINYCQKQDIPVTLFISPMDELRLISTENYDSYVNQVKDIAGEYGVAFYDFNLAKEEYLPIHHGKYFTDSQHLNGAGADLFTSFFAKVISQNASENEKFFYGSYEEKLRNTPPAIYGIYYINQGQEKICYVASNREEGMEYKVTLTPEKESGGGLYRIFRKTRHLSYLRMNMVPVPLKQE